MSKRFYYNESDFRMPTHTTHGEEKKSRTKLSKITNIKRRIEYLGWNDGIIANHCANVMANPVALINQHREPKTGINRSRKKNSKAGIKCCTDCGIVFEVIGYRGQTKPEFHIYKLLDAIRKDKGVCPNCLGESHRYRVIKGN